MGKLKDLIMSFTEADISNLLDLVDSLTNKEAQYFESLKFQNGTPEEIDREMAYLNSIAWLAHRLRKWGKMVQKRVKKSQHVKKSGHVFDDSNM